MKTIAVIGGGAAGMMATAAAAAASLGVQDIEILLFEKNAYLGAKVLISGGGRCNVTSGIFDVKELLKNYPRGAKFLMTAMFRLPPKKVIEWFENHDVPLKIEEDLRVFPVSDNGKDVVEALEHAARNLGVRIWCNAAVSTLTKQYEKFNLGLKDGRTFDVDAVILTTGGNAYRHTGSTGDGYAFAQGLGHTITPLASSLSSFIIGEPWISRLMGVSFEKVKLRFLSAGGQSTYERTGPCVFTHRGISGPAVFALSAYAAYEKIDATTPAQLYIDFFPDHKMDQFKMYFSDLIQKNAKKNPANFLDILMPKSFCSVLVKLLSEPSFRAVGSLPKATRERIISLLKAFPLTLVGRSGGEEFVTAGGVDLREVNTNTMESKIRPGLYFAGEILDVDGFTGGYNLQASWATGALAGENAIRSCIGL